MLIQSLNLKTGLCDKGLTCPSLTTAGLPVSQSWTPLPVCFHQKDGQLRLQTEVASCVWKPPYLQGGLAFSHRSLVSNKPFMSTMAPGPPCASCVRCCERNTVSMALAVTSGKAQFWSVLMLFLSTSHFLGNGPRKQNPLHNPRLGTWSDYLYVAHRNHFKVYRLTERLVTWDNKTFTAYKIVQGSLSPHGTEFRSCFSVLQSASELTVLLRCPQKIMTYVYSFKHKTKQ